MTLRAPTSSLPLHNNLNRTNNQNYDRQANYCRIRVPGAPRVRYQVVVAQCRHDQAHGDAEDAAAEGEDLIKRVFQIHRTQDTQQENQASLGVFEPLPRIGGFLTGAAGVALKYEIRDENRQGVAEDEVDDESDLYRLDNRIVRRHHFHDNWLVQGVAVRVVAQLGEADVGGGEEAQGDGEDGRELLPIPRRTHNRHHTAYPLKHKERKPDGVPVAVVVYRHEAHFLEVVVDYYILLRNPLNIRRSHPLRLILQLILYVVHMVDIFTNTKRRDGQECYDYHCECKNEALFELFNFSDPGHRREESQHNQAKVLLLQVLGVKYRLRSRPQALYDE